MIYISERLEYNINNFFLKLNYNISIYLKNFIFKLFKIKNKNSFIYFLKEEIKLNFYKNKINFKDFYQKLTYKISISLPIYKYNIKYKRFFIKYNLFLEVPYLYKNKIILNGVVKNTVFKFKKNINLNLIHFLNKEIILKFNLNNKIYFINKNNMFMVKLDNKIFNMFDILYYLKIFSYLKNNSFNQYINSNIKLYYYINICKFKLTSHNNIKNIIYVIKCIFEYIKRYKNLNIKPSKTLSLIWKNNFISEFIKLANIIFYFKFNEKSFYYNGFLKNTYLEDFNSSIFNVLEDTTYMLLNKFNFKLKKLSNKVELYKDSILISPLLQYSDQINPLTEINNNWKILKSWPSKFKHSYSSLKVRGISLDVLSKICLIDTSEGVQSGLVVFTAGNAILKKNKLKNSLNWKYGFLILKNIINRKNKITFDIKFQANSQNFIFTSYKYNKYNIYYKFSNNVSLKESMLPFILYNDPTRCMVGAKMQTQALPLIYKNNALISTNFQYKVSGSFNNILKSYTEGIVKFVSSYKIVILDIFKREIIYFLQKYKYNNQFILFNQQPYVWVGERIFIGQVIADSTGFKNNELSLGRDINVGYTNLYGHEYEDAIIISKKSTYNRMFSTVYFKSYEISYIINSYTCEFSSSYLVDINNFNKLKLNNVGYIKNGFFLNKNDILITKFTYKFRDVNFINLNNIESKLFGVNFINIKDKSIYINKDNMGRIIRSEIFLKNEYNVKDKYLKIKIYLGFIKNIEVGDKLSNRYGNKGVVSYVPEEWDFPHIYAPFNLNMIVSLISIPSRLNIGQVVESIYGLYSYILNKRILITNNLSLYLNINYFKIYLYNKLRDLKGGFITNINNTYLGYNKMILKSGKTGFNTGGSCILGVNYYSKLTHIVKLKLQVREFGSYNILTQQPLKSKNVKGAQRFGEMEIWALKSYGSSYNIQELMVYKSDDIDSRNYIYNYLINDIKLKENKLPEIFKIIIKELKGLTLNLDSFYLKDYFNIYNKKLKLT